MLHALRRVRRERLRERILDRLRAEHARPRAGDRDAHARARLRDEHADQREARRRVAGTSRTPPSSATGKLTDVMISSSASAVSYMPLKKSSAAILRLLVFTVAFNADDRGRIIGCRIVVRDRAADRAHVAHLAVADAFGERRKRRDRALHVLRRRDFGMARHRADHDASPSLRMPPARGCPTGRRACRAARGAASSRRRGSARRRAPCRPVLREQRRRVGDRVGLLVVRSVHALSPLRRAWPIGSLSTRDAATPASGCP